VAPGAPAQPLVDYYAVVRQATILGARLHRVAVERWRRGGVRTRGWRWVTVSRCSLPSSLSIAKPVCLVSVDDFCLAHLRNAKKRRKDDDNVRRYQDPRLRAYTRRPRARVPDLCPDGKPCSPEAELTLKMTGRTGGTIRTKN